MFTGKSLGLPHAPARRRANRFGDPVLTSDLITVSDLYCAARGLSRARVSTLIFNAGKTLDGIAEGRDLGTRSFERAMAWFSANWPEGRIWPEGIERPEAGAFARIEAQRLAEGQSEKETRERRAADAGDGDGVSPRGPAMAAGATTAPESVP